MSNVARPRLSDVAARAGVSLMTVSNVINGRFAQMGAPTRLRVEEAIRELGYRPHAAGRSLRLDERLNIGMLVVDESPSFLSDPFTAHLIAGLSNYLSMRGYGVVVQGAKPEELGGSVFMRRFATDGLCVLLSGPPAHYRQHVRLLASLGQPVIAFEWPEASADSNICCIRQDNFGGARKLVRHLLDRGARSFLMALPRLSWPAILERRRGVESVLGRQPNVRLEIVTSAESFDETQRAIAALLDADLLPDAIIGGNDQMAIAAMRLVMARGLRVPQDIMLTGYNAFEFRAYTAPTLTSILSPVEQMGARAAEELLRKLQTGSFSSRDIVLPTELVLGGST